MSTSKAFSQQPFDLQQFVQRERRRMERLTRAAYGVGETHAWFRKASRERQVEKVREWVEEALEVAAERRRGGVPHT